MFSVLRMELKRAIINRLFIISVIIGCIITTMQTIQDSLPLAFGFELPRNIYPPSVYNYYIGLSMNVWSFVFYMIFPLLAALPYADSFFTDKSSGFVKVLVLHTNKKNYLTAKLISVFLSGGIAVVLPLFFNLLITALCVPAVIPDVSVGIFPIFGNFFASKIYYTYPLVYILLFDLIIFITSGILACSALLFSYFIKYKYIVMLSPFMLFIAVSYGSSAFSTNNKLDISKWIIPNQQYQNFDLLFVLFELFFIFIITCFVFYFKGIREDVL